jgi:hypothetical protein
MPGILLITQRGLKVSIRDFRKHDHICISKNAYKFQIYNYNTVAYMLFETKAW